MPDERPRRDHRESPLPAHADGGLDPAEPADRLEVIADTLAHDVGNHLSVARGYLELAREEPGEGHLDNIEGAIDRLDQLVADVVSLARSGSLVTEHEAVELAAVAEDAWVAVPTPETATLEFAESRLVRADRSALQHLLENLFRNAVVHAGRTVTVTVNATDGGFCVADDGPGIPDDRRELVFESGRQYETGGSGLGLAIVERIAAAHGWSIGVVDSEHEGACFLVEGVETD